MGGGGGRGKGYVGRVSSRFPLTISVGVLPLLLRNTELTLAWLQTWPVIESKPYVVPPDDSYADLTSFHPCPSPVVVNDALKPTTFNQCIKVFYSAMKNQAFCKHLHCVQYRGLWYHTEAVNKPQQACVLIFRRVYIQLDGMVRFPQDDFPLPVVTLFCCALWVRIKRLLLFFSVWFELWGKIEARLINKDMNNDIVQR